MIHFSCGRANFSGVFRSHHESVQADQERRVGYQVLTAACQSQVILARQTANIGARSMDRHQGVDDELGQCVRVVLLGYSNRLKSMATWRRGIRTM